MDKVKERHTVANLEERVSDQQLHMFLDNGRKKCIDSHNLFANTVTSGIPSVPGPGTNENGVHVQLGYIYQCVQGRQRELTSHFRFNLQLNTISSLSRPYCVHLFAPSQCH